MVTGQECKKQFERGITILEALVSTAIIAIGFIAIFQMVQYSIRSIDVSGERTKSNLLISMVAEDLISEKNATSPTNKVSLVDYLVGQEKSGKASWNAPSCVSGSSANQSFNNTVDTKKYKWTNRFSKRRLKCKGTENKKELKVYDICNNAASGNVCTYNNNKDYNGTGIYDQLVIGRMEVNVSTGRIDNSGNKKPKKSILYFQIR
tara:strand:- start:164 stop:781 length:618 start_codon:yes stop_codon:yes gene_type:complete